MVRNLVTQYFPDQSASVSTSDDETKWLKSVLENLKTQIVSNNQSNHSTPSTPITANHLNNNSSNNNCHEVENSISSSTKALNGDTNSASTADNEIILLQNAQLRTTVEEYKNIISETVSSSKY